MILQLKSKHFQGAQFQSMHNCPIYNAAKEILGDTIGVNTSQIVIDPRTFYTFRKNKSSVLGYSENDFKDDFRRASSNGFDESVVQEIDVVGLANR